MFTFYTKINIQIKTLEKIKKPLKLQKNWVQKIRQTKKRQVNLKQIIYQKEYPADKVWYIKSLFINVLQKDWLRF